MRRKCSEIHLAIDKNLDDIWIQTLDTQFGVWEQVQMCRETKLLQFRRYPPYTQVLIPVDY